MAVILLAASGLFLGRWFSSLRRPYWMFGYFVPLALILTYGVAIQYPRLQFVAPVSWMMVGRNKFAVIKIVAAMVLTTPLSRLPGKRIRVLVTGLILVIVSLMSVWPFLAPALNRGYLSRLKTRVDEDGVCRQSNDYNCGPASAVTALRRLGFPAEEGEIAILAHTSTATGTPPDILARALQEHYGKEGLESEYTLFESVDQLKEAGLTLAVIKFSFKLDHYVTVLEINDTEIVIGDPLNGKRTISRKEFEKQWRFEGSCCGTKPWVDCCYYRPILEIAFY